MNDNDNVIEFYCTKNELLMRIIESELIEAGLRIAGNACRVKDILNLSVHQPQVDFFEIGPYPDCTVRSDDRSKTSDSISRHNSISKKPSYHC